MNLSDDFTYASVLKSDYKRSSAAKKGWMTRRQHGRGGRPSPFMNRGETPAQTRNALKSMADSIKSGKPLKMSQKQLSVAIRRAQKQGFGVSSPDKSGVVTLTLKNGQKMRMMAPPQKKVLPRRVTAARTLGAPRVASVLGRRQRQQF